MNQDTRKRRCAWPSLDGESIVWWSDRHVDGAPLPYTAAMLERRTQRLANKSQQAFDALPHAWDAA